MGFLFLFLFLCVLLSWACLPDLWLSCHVTLQFRQQWPQCLTLSWLLIIFVWFLLGDPILVLFVKPGRFTDCKPPPLPHPLQIWQLSNLIVNHNKSSCLLSSAAVCMRVSSVATLETASPCKSHMADGESNSCPNKMILDFNVFLTHLYSYCSSHLQEKKKKKGRL